MTIIIKDLQDNIDLDREAMLTIAGGARTRGRPSLPERPRVRSSRIVPYPAGFTARPLTDVHSRAAENKPLK